METAKFPKVFYQFKEGSSSLVRERQETYSVVYELHLVTVKSKLTRTQYLDVGWKSSTQRDFLLSLFDYYFCVQGSFRTLKIMCQ